MKKEERTIAQTANSRMIERLRTELGRKTVDYAALASGLVEIRDNLYYKTSDLEKTISGSARFAGFLNKLNIAALDKRVLKRAIELHDLRTKDPALDVIYQHLPVEPRAWHRLTRVKLERVSDILVKAYELRAEDRISARSLFEVLQANKDAKMQYSASSGKTTLPVVLSFMKKLAFENLVPWRDKELPIDNDAQAVHTMLVAYFIYQKLNSKYPYDGAMNEVLGLVNETTTTDAPTTYVEVPEPPSSTDAQEPEKPINQEPQPLARPPVERHYFPEHKKLPNPPKPPKQMNPTLKEYLIISGGVVSVLLLLALFLMFIVMTAK